MDIDDDYVRSLMYDEDLESSTSVSGVDSAIGYEDRHFGRSGTTFATMRAASSPMRTRSTSRNAAYGGSSREAYWFKNQPVMQKFDWGHTTIQLPVIAPYTETKQVKKQIHITTVNKIRKSRASWGDKGDMLAARFNEVAPMASTEANTAIADIMHFSNDCYTFQDAELADRNAQTIDTPGDPDFDNAARQRARFVKFTLGITPRNIDTNTERVDADKLQRPAHTMVYLRGILNRNRLHQCMTREICITHPKQLIDLYDTRDEPFDLLIRAKGDPSAQAFRKWLDEVRDEARFEALTQITEAEYVGKMEGLETITQRLQKLKQSQFNPQTKKTQVSSVQELHERYQSILSEFSGDNPEEGNDIPSLAHMFHNALHYRLQEKVTDHLPAPNPTNFQDNLNRYNAFKIHVSKAEQELKGIISLVRPILGTGNRTPYKETSTRAFTATRNPGNQDEAYDEHEEETHNYNDDFTDDEDGKPASITMPPMTMFAGQKEKKLITKLITCLSVAETALREASGTTSPMRCWGCQGVQEFSTDCFHKWQECPRKGDHRVIQSFQENLEKFKAQRRARDGTRQWRRQGYPSQQMATKIAAIAKPSTSASVRKVLIATLADNIKPRKQEQAYGDRAQVDEDASSEEEPKPKRTKNTSKKYQTTMAQLKPTSPKRDKGKPRRKGRAFLQYYNGRKPAPNNSGRDENSHGMMFFNERKQRCDFAISDKLPYLEISIGTGDEDDEEKIHPLSGLLDSGGCCNMGWLAYHQKIYERYPYIVSNFFKLAEEQFEDINIGGIKDGVWITHIIEYWLPFSSKEGQATLKIGLTEDLPISTLFGLPFQIAAHIKPDWNNHTAVSQVFKTTFKIRMQKPERPSLDSLDYEEGRPKTLTTREPRRKRYYYSSSSESSSSEGDSDNWDQGRQD